jgi:hypothetical protein
MVGYLVGGAFLSLAYYDFFYYVLATLVITKKVIAHQLAARKVAQGAKEALTDAPLLAPEGANAHY